ncbi:ribosome-recycling factor-like protein [Dinothrombium tinctorium]|uniref:Ribosome-recycling factor, mitochondrial n=1 Tax=Dinothrombium tinctorium TaxID=1965070 RepID=A0A3S3P1W4_9ACAR|nr:ribosome-recycling factor-like protein [Dinothrombium tinctorium]RWS10256.1 ribosome-recycling factor-like protein [Dinothrombium tinctorium]RWS10261.1 ribosome-recycling factor-like protein [Dinothrombium tinctorium]
MTAGCANNARSFAKKAKAGKAKENKPKVMLTDEEMMEVLPVDELKIELSTIIDGFKHELTTNLRIRSGTGIEDLSVEFEGEEHPLKEIAQVAKKSPLLIAINVASLPEAIKPILKAIQDSGMNLNPQQEGTMIYVPIPKVTREHREALAKNAKQFLNKAKEDIRNIQNHYMKIAKRQKDEGVSADLVFNVTENVKYMADKTFEQCDHLLQLKLKELLGDQ